MHSTPEWIAQVVVYSTKFIQQAIMPALFAGVDFLLNLAVHPMAVRLASDNITTAVTQTRRVLPKTDFAHYFSPIKRGFPASGLEWIQQRNVATTQKTNLHI